MRRSDSGLKVSCPSITQRTESGILTNDFRNFLLSFPSYLYSDKNEVKFQTRLKKLLKNVSGPALSEL